MSKLTSGSLITKSSSRSGFAAALSSSLTGKLNNMSTFIQDYKLNITPTSKLHVYTVPPKSTIIWEKHT